MPSITGIKETCLYCADLTATRDFYTALFKFPVMVEDPARFCALDVGGVSVLLLFKKGATLEPMPVPDDGGIIPAHDGDGALHIGVDDPEAHNPQVVKALVEAGAEVQFVSEVRRSLEDVYFSLINNEPPGA